MVLNTIAVADREPPRFRARGRQERAAAPLLRRRQLGRRVAAAHKAALQARPAQRGRRLQL